MPAQKSSKSENLETPSTTPTPPPKIHILYFVECSNGIVPSHVDEIEKIIGENTNDVLYLVLHTYGGDIYSAVRIMRILQNKFKKINVIIPDYAYSSGTIMSLGSDLIYMAVDASLGPLDKPQEHPNDGSEISSIDITQTLTNLTSFCTSAATQIYTKLRDGNMKLSKKEATSLAFDTATKLVVPVIEKIDPYLLQRGFREAKIGLLYAIDMLSTRMMKGKFKKAVNTSKILVDEYPSHGYNIFREEAQYYLGLTIAPLELLPEWKIIEPKFNTLKNNRHIVEYHII